MHDFDNVDLCRYDELNVPISIVEVQKAIKRLKRNKTSGIDLLINEYFISCCDILASHIVDLFNAVLNTGRFPRSWSKGVIVPVFKKNDPDDVRNYRGITLVSCLGKLFTSVLNQRISTWAESYDILSDAQFGFRHGRSTTDAIFVLNAIINKILSDKQRLYCAFIDMRRAFDSVYLNAAWLKLYGLGIEGKCLRVIRDMYSQVKNCVKHCDSYSEFFDCAVGLKQGEILSPIIFALFLEDLELFLQENNSSGLSLNDVTFILMLFADDMAILGNSVADLQNSLDLLSRYCLKWGLEVNTDKSKIVVFRKHGNVTENERWVYNNNEIEIVDNFNYLGTVFNYNGSFVFNQETLSGKGLKALNVLISKTKHLNLKPSVMCQLFDAFVGSIVNYSCEVWGFGKSTVIEKVHLKFLKRLLHVKPSSSNMSVYGELGRFPMFIYRYIRIIKFWTKVLYSDNILVQTLYNSLVESHNKTNWAYKVKHLLDQFGFSYVWDSPSTVDMKTFHLIFGERVKDVFIQKWYTAISSSTKYNTYSAYKQNFTFEKYMDLLPSKYRISLSKLRLSSHKLQIEIGRYSRNDRNQRVCLICNSGDIEDEYHFIIVCPVYNQLRSLYIKRYYYSRPSVYKFTEMMNSNKKIVIKNVAKFIYNAFNLRLSLLNNNV